MLVLIFELFFTNLLVIPSEFFFPEEIRIGELKIVQVPVKGFKKCPLTHLTHTFSLFCTAYWSQTSNFIFVMLFAYFDITIFPGIFPIAFNGIYCDAFSIGELLFLEMLFYWIKFETNVEIFYAWAKVLFALTDIPIIPLLPICILATLHGPVLFYWV